MSKQGRRRFALVAAVACLFGPVVASPLSAPTARADSLPNGYSVSCTPNGANASCSVSGCPRVHEDLAGDVIHVRVNGGPQSQIGKACNNTATVTGGAATTGFTLSIQGCRTQVIGGDECGAWADYRYTPPATLSPAPPPAAPPGGPSGPQPSAPRAPSPNSPTPRPNPGPPNHQMGFAM